jgi:hypothetical protein
LSKRLSGRPRQVVFNTPEPDRFHALGSGVVAGRLAAQTTLSKDGCRLLQMKLEILQVFDEEIAKYKFPPF